MSLPMRRDVGFHGALGTSAAMRRIFSILPRIAARDSTVLLEGETGTGKGVLARAIHRASARASADFVVVDCSSMPATLIESELFGYEKGAFTGATTARQGVFEAAHGGTIFLDEIGELPIDMQPKLLRALEERTIRRLGSTEPIVLDVRVIAATNRDLRVEVANGHFRSDLYYRLDIVKLRVPPLRERREDIPLFVAHFYREITGSDGGPPPELLARICCRGEWPGNVRELRAAVERALLIGDEDPPPQTPAELDVERFLFDDSVSFRSAKETWVSRWERWYVEELIRRHGGNLSRAARRVAMDRNHLRELARRHGIAATDGGRVKVRS